MTSPNLICFLNGLFVGYDLPLFRTPPDADGKGYVLNYDQFYHLKKRDKTYLKNSPYGAMPTLFGSGYAMVHAFSRKGYCVGDVVSKKSGKPFKSKLKENTIKGFLHNNQDPQLRLAAIFVEDDSVVNLHLLK